MKDISDILGTVLAKRGLKDHAQASLIVHQAQTWLQEHLGNMCEYITVTQFKDATLFIEAKHSIAAQECNAHLHALKKHLSDTCHHDHIEQIQILRSFRK